MQVHVQRQREVEHQQSQMQATRQQKMQEEHDRQVEHEVAMQRVQRLGLKLPAPAGELQSLSLFRQSQRASVL